MISIDKKIPYIFSFVFLMELTGCTNSSQNDPFERLINSMAWIKSANPNIDANNAYEKNDFRFLGISGYGLSLPGLSPSDRSIAINEKKYKIIGYCEIIEDQEHLDLCKLADNYAELYNTDLLNLISKKKIKQ
ncbi:MAG: hypothetical protein N0E59_13680 [Candidatus Thiodiazotropha taylori]|nr:hypothetical protein [Candidatus Thiodiazotropha taylori]MCG8096940.1 hypothetical protein [Candidatus Thiodiazotropha endolucinida]MCG8026947.1 hypothetical protein [Candidatus Thiodiazotropha taylori]MCG8085541.1 hypothetical protein [Candidatus Thiodiazotropha taylori]MCG8111805.1 hypothetical protein [Candidatus Thiodiazotropha taylori]